MLFAHGDNSLQKTIVVIDHQHIHVEIGRSIVPQIFVSNVGRQRRRRLKWGYPIYWHRGKASHPNEFAKRGFEPDMYLADMVRPNLDDIPQAPMPDGLVVREPTSDEFRKVWEADVEAFRDHHGASEPREEWFENWISQPDMDPSLWRVAWDGDEVAGQVRSYIDVAQNEEYGRLRGWTEDISTRRPYRGRGLARSLLCQSLEAVRDAGMTEAALSVHTANKLGAYRLYESVGFVVENSEIFFTKPFAPPN